MTCNLDYEKLVEMYCLAEDLSCSDPYDIWKTKPGYVLKKGYALHPVLFLPLVAGLTIFDVYINNRMRLGYERKEYPVVRAFAAICCSKQYIVTRDERYAAAARSHLRWLKQNAISSGKGIGWGLGFDWAVSKELSYDRNTPLVTATPYVLEAFLECARNGIYDLDMAFIRKIASFFVDDVVYEAQSNEAVSSSYSNKKDRTVVNASAYSMYSLALVSQYLSELDKKTVEARIPALYQFIVQQQEPDGAIFYSTENNSFIDCFHTCFVLKNIIKTNNIFSLDDSSMFVEKTYLYIKCNFYREKYSLFSRFSVANKPGIVKFDLYDNAEMLNLAVLMKDYELADRLAKSIKKYFVNSKGVFSQIDFLGRRYNLNMGRWAVLPYLHSLSVLEWSKGA